MPVTAPQRIRVETEGIVQGVGFRPFVFRLAGRHGISGWVCNTPRGVLVEAEGLPENLAAFLRGISAEPPPLAEITAIRSERIPILGKVGFLILPSTSGENDIHISPDCDVCSYCLEELFDPGDRRYRYPFINCTNCGPRYSIITGSPYDRHKTTMAAFTMCEECRAEYEDPADRRFHAQPNACPACGPQLLLTDGAGHGVVTHGDASLRTAIDLLREGGILAVKGLGGYHLAADACNEAAVRELRRRKRRDEKPFALMAAGLPEVGRFARGEAAELRLLAGPERPVVLLPKREENPIAPQVAPANGYFGVMLPSTPLHHLLLRCGFTALVMTSGNISDEPTAYGDAEARERLRGVADLFLVHDRDIHTRTDDSVLRVFQGQPLFLRRSRGYVPRPVKLPSVQRSVVAMGGELKATVCLTRNDRAFMSQHIGDLKNAATLLSLEETVANLERILEIKPTAVAHDLHPDFLSTRLAAGLKVVPQVPVQHHHAHMAACMAENGLEGEAIGVVFDGAGYGPDGTIWGGEFLLGDYREVRRFGHFRTVRMPGGDAAVLEPFRMAISYLHELYGEALYNLPLPCLAEAAAQDRQLFSRMLERGINSPFTSSCGRLFDAVAAIIGLRSRITYEGQAAMELEALAEQADTELGYPYDIAAHDGELILDLRPLLGSIVSDVTAKKPRPVIARRFHNTVARAAADVCEEIGSASGVNRVVLSGGVFQNRLISEGLFNRLKTRGFHVFTHRLVPPNDGGLALGQAVIAGRADL